MGRYRQHRTENVQLPSHLAHGQAGCRPAGHRIEAGLPTAVVEVCTAIRSVATLRSPAPGTAAHSRPRPTAADPGTTVLGHAPAHCVEQELAVRNARRHPLRPEHLSKSVGPSQSASHRGVEDVFGDRVRLLELQKMPGVRDDVHRAAWRQDRAERPGNFALMRRRCSICSTGLPRYHELSQLD